MSVATETLRPVLRGDFDLFYMDGKVWRSLGKTTVGSQKQGKDAKRKLRLARFLEPSASTMTNKLLGVAAPRVSKQQSSIL